jgi:hypothetical protein
VWPFRAIYSAGLPAAIQVSMRARPASHNARLAKNAIIPGCLVLGSV